MWIRQEHVCTFEHGEIRGADRGGIRYSHPAIQEARPGPGWEIVLRSKRGYSIEL